MVAAMVALVMPSDTATTSLGLWLFAGLATGMGHCHAASARVRWAGHRRSALSTGSRERGTPAGGARPASSQQNGKRGSCRVPQEQQRESW
jgi:hypothetical protein